MLQALHLALRALQHMGSTAAALSRASAGWLDEVAGERGRQWSGETGAHGASWKVGGCLGVKQMYCWRVAFQLRVAVNQQRAGFFVLMAEEKH